MRSTVRVVLSRRSHPVIAVLSAITLSIVLRLPLLQWPWAERPDAPCCGNPDEMTHYDLVRALRAGEDPGSYPPALAFWTNFLLEVRAGAADAPSSSAVSPSADQRDRIRMVSTARVLCVAFAGAAVLILFLIGIQMGLSPWSATACAAFLAFAPLYLVQTTYALADAPNVALLLACTYVFLKWDCRRRWHQEILFGFLLGGLLAIKLVGVVVAIPLAASMIARSAVRLRTTLSIAISFTAGVYLLSGGHVRFASPSSLVRTIVVENMHATRVRPAWNAVHHVLSLVPGMGAFFAVLLAASFAWWLVARASSWRASPSRFRPLDTLPAIAIGSLLYFVGICFSSNPFTRHMLALYPFLILFTLRATDSFLRRHVAPGRLTRAAALLFVCALAYNAFASWPVVRSFARDPVNAAGAWVLAQTRCEPAVPAFRNFPPVPSACPGPSGGRELLIVHSAWLGRLTGSWWLKPSPKDLRDVYHFDGKVEDLRFWRELIEDRSTEGRVLASFGDDWKTPERLFLSLIGRGYDQFVTAGRAYIVARTAHSG